MVGENLMWEMHDKEFETVRSLPPDERYSYTIKRVADWEVLWCLAEGGEWVLSADDEGNEIIPVWPHQRFAGVCAEGEWDGYDPRPIELSTWMDHWLPELRQEKRLVSVFPVPSAEDRGMVVFPDRFREDLESELDLYE
jgi:Protein of unknown function (DUF2750)